MLRTKDGRFIEKRVSIPLPQLKKIILEVKKNNKYTWKEFSQALGVSEDTIRINWYIKGRSIPFSLFEKLLSLSSLNKEDITFSILDPFLGQKNGIKSQIEAKIFLPQVNDKAFAEFLGIMSGDGCLYSNLSGICISGHKILDEQYYKKYLSELIVSLFRIRPHFYYSQEQNEIRCVIYSKKLALFFKNLGFPLGKKLYSQLVIPQSYFGDKPLLESFLRGMFDTDGTIYPHKSAKAIIEISIKHKDLKESCFKAFEILKLPSKKSTDRIYFIGSKNVSLFFTVIGSSNFKQQKKYEIFTETGSVPKNFQIESYLKDCNLISTMGQ